MTDTTTVAPPLTRRQAREIERRTGVRPVATVAATGSSVATAQVAAVAQPRIPSPAATPAATVALAEGLRDRLEVAADTARARVRTTATAPVTNVTSLPTVADELATTPELHTTAELSRDAVAAVPAAFGGPEQVRVASIRAAKPVALVRRQRRMRGAGVAFAASAASLAVGGALIPGVGLTPDVAQASLVTGDAIVDPATQPQTQADVDTSSAAGGGVSTAPLVAAPETAVDRSQYSVTTVSAEGVSASATPEATAAAAAPVVEEAITYAHPYPTGAMNEGYGTRGGAHNGIDMVGGGCGADLVAVAAGTVTYVGYQGGYGNHVEIKLEDGTTVSYSHLQSSSPLAVGQTVAPGDYVGPVGTTGNSTGCHLHFEVKVGGSFVDPVGWLAARGISV